MLFFNLRKKILLIAIAVCSNLPLAAQMGDNNDTVADIFTLKSHIDQLHDKLSTLDQAIEAAESWKLILMNAEHYWDELRNQYGDEGSLPVDKIAEYEADMEAIKNAHETIATYRAHFQAVTDELNRQITRLRQAMAQQAKANTLPPHTIYLPSALIPSPSGPMPFIVPHPQVYFQSWHMHYSWPAPVLSICMGSQFIDT